MDPSSVQHQGGVPPPWPIHSGDTMSDQTTTQLNDVGGVQQTGPALDDQPNPAGDTDKGGDYTSSKEEGPPMASLSAAGDTDMADSPAGGAEVNVAAGIPTSLEDFIQEAPTPSPLGSFHSDDSPRGTPQADLTAEDKGCAQEPPARPIQNDHQTLHGARARGPLLWTYIHVCMNSGLEILFCEQRILALW